MTKSPCIKHCTLHDGVCAGCGRTVTEITQWSRMTNSEREAVMRRLHPQYGRDHAHELADRTPPVDAETCPRCGEYLPDHDPDALCLCPWCGGRICEGVV